MYKCLSCGAKINHKDLIFHTESCEGFMTNVEKNKVVGSSKVPTQLFFEMAIRSGCSDKVEKVFADIVREQNLEVHDYGGWKISLKKDVVDEKR